uniref:NR LBD domain-containing protein n=2 Tax=Bursaphelenchus xylophilus TaxID=6326 RepID=A0A1I7SW88_BURXY
MAEMFLLGPEVFKDAIILDCFNRLMDEYLIKRAESGLLSLKLTKSVSGLDAFFPFYEDLLKRYGEFSLADDNFALMLLIPAYMNASLSDALTIRLLLWSEHTEIVRQMTLGMEKASFLVKYVNSNMENMTNLLKQTLADPFNLLMVSYKAALENNVVLKERNPLLYHLATIGSVG